MTLEDIIRSGVLDGSTGRGWWARRVCRRYRRMFGEGLL